MKGKLTIVAIIEANPSDTAFVKEELLKLIPFTRKEEGCIQYDLHQDNEKENEFVFFENWENRDLWQQHMNSDHIKSYMAVTEGKIANFTVHEMTYTDN